MGDSSIGTGNVMIVAIEPGKRQTVQTILEADCQEVTPGVNINEFFAEVKYLEELAAFKAKALEEMDVLSKKLDRTPIQRDYDRDKDTTLCSRRIIRRFHGWNNFVDAAGLKRRRPGVYRKGASKRQKALQKKEARTEHKEKDKEKAVEEGKKILAENGEKISNHKLAKLLGHDYRTIERWFDSWDNYRTKLA